MADHTHAPEDGSRNMAFFDRRVDAILSLITGQGTGKYDPDLQRRAIEHYNRFEDPARSTSESWILAIKALTVETGALSETEIEEKLAAVRQALESAT
ncbi:MAG: nitrile hydratase subunit beta [Proteobacteria bacterium]|nr:nitrile hydratase subunit beta [Pseudomonadota bacterium]